MCRHGIDRQVTIRRTVSVDACVADFVVWLNEQGVYTTGACCGHGNGQAEFTIYPSAQGRARALGFAVHPPTESTDAYFGVTHEDIATRLSDCR